MVHDFFCYCLRNILTFLKNSSVTKRRTFLRIKIQYFHTNEICSYVYLIVDVKVYNDCHDKFANLFDVKNPSKFLGEKLSRKNQFDILHVNNDFITQSVVNDSHYVHNTISLASLVTWGNKLDLQIHDYEAKLNLW